MKRFFILSSILIVLPFAAAEPAAVRTYDQLIQAIRLVRTSSQTRIETAVEQEKVREAWETGKLIDEHILQHRERADYGDKVMTRLASDLGTSAVELRFMLQFARAYPIRWPASELSWSHYQSLLALNNPKVRDEVEQKAVKEKWTRDQVRDEVRKRKVGTGEETQPSGDEAPAASPRKPYTYRIVPGLKPGEVVIDLGFSTYYDPAKVTREKFKAGDMVRIDFADKKSGSRNSKAKKSTVLNISDSDLNIVSNFDIRASDLTRCAICGAEDLYYYTASVGEVWDGDTFHALIDLGFGITLEQRLRLRRLDAPEVLSREGRQAKAALEAVLKRAKDGKILIKTTPADDQYGRYMVDVFIPAKSRQKRDGAEWGNAVNIDSELLATGLFTLRNDAA